MTIRIIRVSVNALFVISTLVNVSTVHAQDSVTNSIEQIPSGYFSAISDKATSLQLRLDKKTRKTLEEFSRTEERIRLKLFKKDSTVAIKVFGNAESKYNQLQEKLKDPGKLPEYIPYLDTLSTSLKFLEKNPQFLKGVKEGKAKLDKLTENIKGLSKSFEKAKDLKRFLKEREEFLHSQLEKMGFAQELKELNKQAYYFSAQLGEYKELLKNPKKAEQKAIELLTKSKFFQNFMRKNSFLAGLFRMRAEDLSDPAYRASLVGLQTRVQVNSQIQQQIGGTNSMRQFQQSLQAAQSQVNQLKNKLSQYGSGNSDDIMPRGFKPNNEKKKSFLKRLEYGTNFQTQHATSFFPVTSDIGLSVGYKLNDKGIIGIGGSYKIGWGRGWDKINLSNQGVGIRSFIDMKLKGNLFITGGYEQNYKIAFREFRELQNRRAWQESGLIGLSKVSPTSMKLLKKIKMQLLWDFLSYDQIPRTQPIIFRIGYNL